MFLLCVDHEETVRALDEHNHGAATDSVAEWIMLYLMDRIYRLYY